MIDRSNEQLLNEYHEWIMNKMQGIMLVVAIGQCYVIWKETLATLKQVKERNRIHLTNIWKIIYQLQSAI